MPAEGVLHSAGEVLRSAEVVLRSAGAVGRLSSQVQHFLDKNSRGER